MSIQTVEFRTLHTAPLFLECYASNQLSDAQKKSVDRVLERLEDWGKVIIGIIKQDDLCEALSANTWEASVTFVTNPEIQALNREHRQKDQPTDVLTFAEWAHAPHQAQLAALPVVALGDIFISIEWAHAACQTPDILQEYTCDEYPGSNKPASGGLEQQVLEPYLIERLTHGVLHLLGVHHDTITAYNKVVRIQKQVLSQVFQHTPKE